MSSLHIAIFFPNFQLLSLHLIFDSFSSLCTTEFPILCLFFFILIYFLLILYLAFNCLLFYILLFFFFTSSLFLSSFPSYSFHSFSSPSHVTPPYNLFSVCLFFTSLLLAELTPPSKFSFIYTFVFLSFQDDTFS